MTTLEVVLRLVERKYGKVRRVWVFDLCIISEMNLEAIRKRGGQYLVGTPRSKLRKFERQLLEKDWQRERVHPEVEAKTVTMGLEKRVEKGKLKDRHKLERLLGQIQARSPQVADLYQARVRGFCGAR